MRFPIPAILSFCLLTACTVDELEPLVLDITIAANKTSTVPGDSITFEIESQGNALTGILVTWGDGQSYSVQTGLVRTADATLRHAYASAGTYDVNATVTDAEAGSKSARLSIEIR